MLVLHCVFQVLINRLRLRRKTKKIAENNTKMYFSVCHDGQSRSEARHASERPDRHSQKKKNQRMNGVHDVQTVSLADARNGIWTLRNFNRHVMMSRPSCIMTPGSKKIAHVQQTILIFAPFFPTFLHDLQWLWGAKTIINRGCNI